MKSFPLERYRFYFAGNKVIATSTYGGRTVRGVAICHPEDTYSVEIGKKLAAARCNEKIAAKRYARSCRRYNEAEAAWREAGHHLDNMSDYREDSFLAMNEAAQQVDLLIKQIANK